MARRYKALTGKPLGITGEVAEIAAAQLLGLELAEARQHGFDATGIERGRKIRFQIKGRAIAGKPKPGERIGRIRLDAPWHEALLVLLDEDFEVNAIYRASKARVRAALTAPGSRARNERGALSISKFKSIGRLVWPEPTDAT